jgi:hypothetical protein
MEIQGSGFNFPGSEFRIMVISAKLLNTPKPGNNLPRLMTLFVFFTVLSLVAFFLRRYYFFCKEALPPRHQVTKILKQLQVIKTSKTFRNLPFLLRNGCGNAMRPDHKNQLYPFYGFQLC